MNDIKLIPNIGLKCKHKEYYNILTIQRDNIEILKKDTRVSLTKVHILLIIFD